MTNINDRNIAIIAEFRSNEGRIGGRFEGAPVMLLTTSGAKSGKQRINPMMYLPEGDRLYVFATKAGAPTSPDWYHNLVADPDVTVEVGTESYEAKAEVLTGAERDRVYAAQAAIYPFFADYQEKTGGRTIPVVALTRRG